MIVYAMSEGIGTAIIVLLLIVICIFAVRSYCKKLTKGCCGTGDGGVRRIRPQDKNAANYPYAYHVEIDGMSCQNCAVRVENAFHEREGLLAAVDLRGNCADIRAKNPISAEEVREIIRSAGYMPLKITDSEEAGQEE